MLFHLGYTPRGKKTAGEADLGLNAMMNCSNISSRHLAASHSVLVGSGIEVPSTLGSMKLLLSLSSSPQGLRNIFLLWGKSFFPCILQYLNLNSSEALGFWQTKRQWFLSSILPYPFPKSIQIFPWMRKGKIRNISQNKAKTTKQNKRKILYFPAR